MGAGDIEEVLKLEFLSLVSVESQGFPSMLHWCLKRKVTRQRKEIDIPSGQWMGVFHTCFQERLLLLIF